MTVATVNVTGTVVNGEGLPVVGATVIAKLTSALTDGTILYESYDPVTTTTSSSGAWSIPVVPNDAGLTPAGSAWSFSIQNGIEVLLSAVVKVSTANSPSVALLSLTNLVTPPPLVATYVSQLLAGTNVTLSPTSGVGAVTVNASGGGGGLVSLTSPDSSVTIGGTLTAPTLAVASTIQTEASGAAQKANNLSDLASASSARTNLGLGTAATLASTAVAQTANNLSDLASAASARTNLGLGTAATLASSAVAQTANNLSDLASASSARTNLGLGTSAVAAIDPTATDITMNGTQAAGATGKVADAGHVHPSDTTRAPVPTISSPAYAATIAPAAPANGGKLILNVGTLTGALTLAAPTGSPVDGQEIDARFSENGTGGYAITFNSGTGGYAFGTDVTTAMVPTAASANWEMKFIYNATANKWRCVALARGF